MEDTVPNDGMNDKAKATRRRLDKNGKRHRGKTRRWSAIHYAFAAATLLQLVAAKGIGWRPPKEAGLWSVDTGNVDC